MRELRNRLFVVMLTEVKLRSIPVPFFRHGEFGKQ